MQCRRCAKELPVGQTKTCPYCGVYLETIIKPRAQGGKYKRPNRAPLIMSLMSIALICVVIGIVTAIKSYHSRSDFVQIVETYDELTSGDTEYTNDEWEMRLTSFAASVGNYKKNHPKKYENITVIERYEKMLNGIDPDTDEFVGDTEQQSRYNQNLIRNAQSEILDVTAFSFTPSSSGGHSTVSIRLQNRSGKYIISSVRMAFEAFDQDGNPSIGSPKGGGSQWYARTDSTISPDEEKTYIFNERWNDENIAELKILWLEVEYGPEHKVYFPPAVCDTLWG